ncbi:hypothetical protein H8356DRAFT_1423638 [Neocallimastix lanati (nom. inval.)]|nr:hypothetical protein H8356DRAFT_1423638 [Neocallimastix sp. JGI-2020a]
MTNNNVVILLNSSPLFNPILCLISPLKKYQTLFGFFAIPFSLIKSNIKDITYTPLYTSGFFSPCHRSSAFFIGMLTMAGEHQLHL